MFSLDTLKSRRIQNQCFLWHLNIDYKKTYVPISRDNMENNVLNDILQKSFSDSAFGLGKFNVFCFKFPLDAKKEKKKENYYQ